MDDSNTLAGEVLKGIVAVDFLRSTADFPDSIKERMVNRLNESYTYLQNEALTPHFLRAAERHQRPIEFAGLCGFSYLDVAKAIICMHGRQLNSETGFFPQGRNLTNHSRWMMYSVSRLARLLPAKVCRKNCESSMRNIFALPYSKIPLLASCRFPLR